MLTPLPTPDGRTLDAEVAGADGAPLVLVHHGTPQGRELPTAFRAAAERLGLRLASWARPGYAGSTRRPGRVVADVVDDAVVVADALGADRFATVGGSGGGPHALALGALLPGRCVAVATIASVAPWSAPGLDPLAGMGEGNVVEFAAAVEGEPALVPLLAQWREGMVGAGTAGMLAEMASVLSPPDRAVLSGELGEELFSGTVSALRPGVDGWVDDDLAFVRPWGFELADVRVPTHLWQGGQDLMVPPAHGAWLAEHLPAVTPHLLPAEGHLTLQVTRVEDVLAPLADALR